jgi:2-polyprenyl-6-methoxyphenol hydroxylase-like FAD-dependent oxidoreductase
MASGEATNTQVLIVGAGPVGLTLAIDLGRRGVRCILIEKQDEPRKLPKMERCNARTMEIYRRLGLADAIRQASAPANARMDSLVVTTMADEPLVRLAYSSVAKAREAIASCNDGSMPLEPQQLVSQYTLEPLLKEVAERAPNVTVRTGCELVSFVQDGRSVTAAVEHTDGRKETICADYLVGTDGGRSTVRKQLGIALLGQGRLARKNQIFVRCDNLFDVCPHPQGRMYFFANQDQSILSLQDSLRHFVFHTSCWGDEAELRKLIGETIALPIDFEILATTGWNLHLLVAERYMERRVLLAGDSIHLVIPTGALGLNTGIADAIDLSWKLAGTLAGWAGPYLLPSYDIERRPIGLRSKAASEYAARGQLAWREVVRPNITDDTPEGRGVKAAVIRIASVEQRKTHEQVGTELGYRYELSPLICAESGPWLPDVREVYIPTARPGARLPHAWLADGGALHDQFGDGYTLLRLRRGAGDTSAFERAMRRFGAPFQVIEFDEEPLRAVYRRDLLLLRPDLHVCWRGDEPPANPRAVAAIVTGHRVSAAWAESENRKENEDAVDTQPVFNW